MLQVKNLAYHTDHSVLFQDLCLTVEPQELLIVLGPSGCGKTTLMCILAGLQQPTSGEVHFGSTNLYALPESQRDRFRGEHLGVLFQTFHVIKALNLTQNLTLAQSLTGKVIDDQALYEVLDRLHLANKAHQKAGHLSVGETQRLALARAILGQPQWILCDEPTSALDDQNAYDLLDLIQEEATQSQSSLIIVTHDKRVKEVFTQAQILNLGAML